MITKLRIKNYKSIGEDLPALQLKPLTIFAGKNSSGKSNILEIIAILSQTTRLDRNIVRSLEGSLGYGEFIRYMNTPDFPLFEFIAHKKDLKRHITIETHIADENYKEIGYSYSFMPNEREIHHSIFENEKKLVELSSVKVGESSWKNSFLYPEKLKSLIPSGDTEYILNPHCFNFSPNEISISNIINENNELISKAKIIIEKINNHYNKFYFISALRGDIKPATEVSGITEPEIRLGKHGEGLIEILSLIFRKTEYERISEKILKWTGNFGLHKIKAGWCGGNLLSSDYIDPDLNTRLNIALASHGSKQVLTIITQLFWTPPKSIIAIEEPEISLHPEAQVLMQEMFAEAIKEEKQIIITTHSSFLLLAISEVVRKGLISPDDIAIYHIEKGEEGTTANPPNSLEINENGYITGWIPSFVHVEDQLFRDWAEKME
jgi:predicted ATPase